MAEGLSFIVLVVSLPPRAGTGVPGHVGIPEHPELASCCKRGLIAFKGGHSGTNLLHGEQVPITFNQPLNLPKLIPIIANI
jgi:hypothetical protein